MRCANQLSHSPVFIEFYSSTMIIHRTGSYKLWVVSCPLQVYMCSGLVVQVGLQCELCPTRQPSKHVHKKACSRREGYCWESIHNLAIVVPFDYLLLFTCWAYISFFVIAHQVKYKLYISDLQTNISNGSDIARCSNKFCLFHEYHVSMLVVQFVPIARRFFMLGIAEISRGSILETILYTQQI